MHIGKGLFEQIENSNKLGHVYISNNEMYRTPHHKNRYIPKEHIEVFEELFKSNDEESYKLYVELCNSYPKNGKNHQSKFAEALESLFKGYNK